VNKPQTKKKSKGVKSGEHGAHNLHETLPVHLSVFAQVFQYRIRKMRGCPISFEKQLSVCDL